MKVSVRNGTELAGYEQIKEAGCRLFHSQGYDNTSVKDVINKLQIRKQEFYRYIKLEDGPLEAIWSES